MSFARKLSRKGKNRTSCCGQQMARKEGYDTGNEFFYCCLNCGKEKFIKKAVQSDGKVY